MATIETNPYPHIQLTISNELIVQYNLQDIATNCYKIYHPTAWQILSLYDSEQPVHFPFTFPPKFQRHSVLYLEEFLRLYAETMQSVPEEHHDPILFLAYIYYNASEKKYSKALHNNYLSDSGKLLVEMIKVPIPKLNKSNIYDAFRDDPNLARWEITDIIISYLNLITGTPEEDFIVDKSKWEIDFTKINKKTWEKLGRYIQQDRHVSIIGDEGPPGTPFRDKLFITVSRDFKINFQKKDDNRYKGLKNKLDIVRNKSLLTALLRDLFEIQKKYETKLYKLLLKHDYIFGDEYSSLVTATGAYEQPIDIRERKDANRIGYALEAVYAAISDYFHKHKLIDVSHGPIMQNRKRDDIIFRYLLLLVENTLKLTTGMRRKTVHLQREKEIRALYGCPTFLLIVRKTFFCRG